jgi:alpha-mannosidase
MTCTVYPDKPQVDLAVGLHWRGEASRLRLKIGTEFESSTGIFEVPFGAVRRVPYLSRRTARGEWPVHRWVAIEEAGQGVALINKGNMGAEVMGGTIWTTLLRAPVSEYAGMVSDDTSSQHGDHRFEFSILPYEGSWTTGACIELAQELNSPCYAVPTETMIPEGSLASLAPSTVVLSCIKPPEDDAPGEVIVRFYEAVGRRTQASLYLKGAQGACRSDLREARGDAVTCSDGWISLTVEPFEITTLRVKLSAAAGTE